LRAESTAAASVALAGRGHSGSEADEMLDAAAMALWDAAWTADAFTWYPT